MLELLKWPEGKTPFLIRDDDISFFTRSEMLSDLYSHAWRKGFVVTLSVIPYISGDISPFPGSGFEKPPFSLEYEPCIPPFARGTAGNHKIRDNLELVSFLLEGRKKRVCDMTLHGLSHERSEFLTGDIGQIERILDDAVKMFFETFSFQPKVFVFPYDRGSDSALDSLRQRGMSICRSPLLRTRTPSLVNRVLSKTRLRRLPSYKFVDDITEFYHNMPAFSHHLGFRTGYDTLFEVAKKEFLIRRAQNDLFCLGQHYWEFFFDWEEHVTHNALLKALNVFLDYVESFDVWKTSLNEVSEWLYTFHNILVRRIDKNEMFMKTKLPIRSLSFRTLGTCKIQGIESELIDKGEGIWTLGNIPENTSFRVISH
ncbi:hypothetical protein MUO83_08795 [Candidatus Bathyarchaeota archaeon]|nr:hypothetical protein [Candidatus Bathyarchaeota archaeon]